RGLIARAAERETITAPRGSLRVEGKIAELSRAATSSKREEARLTETCLHIADPAVDLLLGLVFGDAVALLDLADQLDAASFDCGEIVVSELAPLLLDLAAQLLPITFDTVPVHDRAPFR